MCIRRRRRRAATTSPPTAAAMLRRATPPRRTTQAENRPSPAADNALNTYQERITALPSHVTVPWSRNRSRGYPATHQQMQNRHLHRGTQSVSYTHLRAHETKANLVCRLLLEKKKKKQSERTLLQVHFEKKIKRKKLKLRDISEQ